MSTHTYNTPGGAMDPQSVAQDISRLVALPRAYHRVSEMVRDERYGTTDIGRVIAHEPALTARLLRMVNSAYFGLPSRIDTIPMAITVLGTRALHELVLATSVASAFDRIDSSLVDVADFWHHSIYAGLVARLLSRRLRLGHSEQMFIAGLLHDLGKLAIYHRLPEAAQQVLVTFADEGDPRTLYEVERDVLGFDHSAVGEALLRLWQLPSVYVEVAAYHHDPDQAESFPDEVAVVHVADALTRKVEPGHKVARGADDLPLLHPAAAERVRMDPDLVADLRLEADLQAIEVYGTLFGQPPAAG